MFKKKKVERVVDDMNIVGTQPMQSTSTLDQKIRETMDELNEIKRQLAELEAKSREYFKKLEKLDRLKHGKTKIEVITVLDILDELRSGYNKPTLDEVERRILNLIQ